MKHIPVTFPNVIVLGVPFHRNGMHGDTLKSSTILKYVDVEPLADPTSVHAYCTLSLVVRQGVVVKVHATDAWDTFLGFSVLLRLSNAVPGVNQARKLFVLLGPRYMIPEAIGVDAWYGGLGSHVTDLPERSIFVIEFFAGHGHELRAVVDTGESADVND
jgi:hypothetical protein